MGSNWPGGRDRLKGRIFRLAHMGGVDELDIISSLAAIELVLAELGKDVKLGSSVAAAGRVLAEAKNIVLVAKILDSISLSERN